MEHNYKLDTREEISVANINILYYDLKQAQALADVSNQTLYTYAADDSNNITMVKFKGKNYLHRDDIEYIKKEVQASKILRNSLAITIKEKEIIESDDISKLKEDIEALNKNNANLSEELNQVKQDNILKDSTISKLKEDIEALNKSNANLSEELNQVKQDNILKDSTISKLNEDIEKYESDVNELKEDLKKERTDRLNFMSEVFELEKEIGELREFKKNTNNLNEIIKTLSNEKDELYKSQINSLTEANIEIMDKFDKLIDTQNAFQIMLAQKEQTSQKLLEEKNQKGILGKLFGKK